MLAVGLAAVLSGCGAASDRAAEQPASSTTVSTTTTTTTTVLVQPPPPLDVETARCQQIVNEMIASWPRERVEAVVTCRPAIAPGFIEGLRAEHLLPA